MTNAKPARPEPTTGTPYDTYLVPRSKTPLKNKLYEFLLELGWRFDRSNMVWYTPERDTFQAFGRLEYDRNLEWARVQPPNQPGSTNREKPILKLRRTNGTWAVEPRKRDTK